MKAMTTRNESAGVRELLRPFGRLHVLGVALIGSLALAVFTESPFLQAIGLGGSVLTAFWGALLLYRTRQGA